jgi:hypothetical protein
MELERLFSVSEPGAYDLWEEAIAETGFDFADDYSERRWMIGESLFHEVRDDFPRVTPVPVGGAASNTVSGSMPVPLTLLTRPWWIN